MKAKVVLAIRFSVSSRIDGRRDFFDGAKNTLQLVQGEGIVILSIYLLLEVIGFVGAQDICKAQYTHNNNRITTATYVCSHYLHFASILSR